MSTANGKAATLTVTFADEAYETLSELMRRTGRSADDLLSEALALEKKAIETKQAGGACSLSVKVAGARYSSTRPKPPAPWSR